MLDPQHPVFGAKPDLILQLCWIRDLGKQWEEGGLGSRLSPYHLCVGLCPNSSLSLGCISVWMVPLDSPEITD